MIFRLRGPWTIPVALGFSTTTSVAMCWLATVSADELMLNLLSMPVGFLLFWVLIRAGRAKGWREGDAAGYNRAWRTFCARAEELRATATDLSSPAHIPARMTGRALQLDASPQVPDRRSPARR